MNEGDGTRLGGCSTSWATHLDPVRGFLARPTSNDQATAAAYRGLIDDLATALEENRATPPARSGYGAKRKPRAKKHVGLQF
jgi:hypothetical protein